jgi:hypothetical protein
MLLLRLLPAHAESSKDCADMIRYDEFKIQLTFGASASFGTIVSQCLVASIRP